MLAAAGPVVDEFRLCPPSGAAVHLRRIVAPCSLRTTPSHQRRDGSVRFAAARPSFASLGNRSGEAEAHRTESAQLRGGTTSKFRSPEEQKGQ
jgi:hypothetical protein